MKNKCGTLKTKYVSLPAKKKNQTKNFKLSFEIRKVLFRKIICRSIENWKSEIIINTCMKQYQVQLKRFKLKIWMKGHFYLKIANFRIFSNLKKCSKSWGKCVGCMLNTCTPSNQFISLSFLKRFLNKNCAFSFQWDNFFVKSSVK